MEQIKVTPDKDGRIFIKLYGVRYEIIIDTPKKEVKTNGVSKKS